MNKKTIFRIILFSLYSLIGCGSTLNLGSERNRSQYSNLENIDKTINSSQNIDQWEAYMFAIDNVPSGYISHLNWVMDSERLVFSVGSTKWVYDFQSETLSEFNSSTLNEAQHATETLVSALNEMIHQSTDLPGNTVIATMSPSQERAVIFNSSSPTPTPLSLDGENPYTSDSVDVWIWENGALAFLGEIEICGINEYFWSNDESYLFIQMPTLPAFCRVSNGWLINAKEKSLDSILPFNIYGGFGSFHSFSPSEDKIAIEFAGSENGESFETIELISLDRLQKSKLDVPQFTQLVSWFNDHQLLIFSADHINSPKRPQLYDVSTGIVHSLINQEQETILGNNFMNWLSFSPEKKILAFTTDVSPYRVSDLWVIELRHVAR